ncbi:MAG: NAD(P)H-hydrate dehydratase [Candidatus Micrarchaeia archaeon]
MREIINSLHKPEKYSHKGKNGKLMIIGGSRDYSGAPVFSILAARRFVDLLYFYPAQKGPYLINAVKSIPEAIVVYNFEKIKSVDCTLFGIGLSDAKFNYRHVIKNSKKLVIDGDGLYLVKNNIPENSILTPHEIEFKRIFELDGTLKNVCGMAKKWNCTILKKDPRGDIISDGKKTKMIKGGNCGMTKGGTGDVLAGIVSALFCKNDAFVSACYGAHLNRKAGEGLYQKFGFNYSASDLADNLARV